MSFEERKKLTELFPRFRFDCSGECLKRGDVVEVLETEQESYLLADWSSPGNIGEVEGIFTGSKVYIAFRRINVFTRDVSRLMYLCTDCFLRKLKPEETASLIFKKDWYTDEFAYVRFSQGPGIRAW